MKNLAEINEGADVVTKDYVTSQAATLDVTYTAGTKNLTIDVVPASNADNTEY